MKAEIKEESFKPITIELTIESEDELLDLYHRTNIAHDCVYTATYITDTPIPNFKNQCYELFKEIYNIIEKR